MGRKSNFFILNKYNYYRKKINTFVNRDWENRKINQAK